VRYDLWDEVFALHTLVDGATRNVRTVKSAEEAMAFLRNVRLMGLFARGAPMRAGALVLKAEVLLNPIDRERMEAIRKWVQENTARSCGRRRARGGKIVAPMVACGARLDGIHGGRRGSRRSLRLCALRMRSC
jgi:hypothetical protein